MDSKINELTTAMITLYHNDPKRIHHFMKVYAFASAIAKSEQVNAPLQMRIEAAALVHDIGIHAAERKYHSAAGNYQEKEGPPLARAMLSTIGFSEPFVDRVCFLVGHHHTYSEIDGLDFQILIEADFLVNAMEENMTKKSILHFRNVYFSTETGKQYLDETYGLNSFS
jgi:hypothetical protein